MNNDFLPRGARMGRSRFRNKPDPFRNRGVNDLGASQQASNPQEQNSTGQQTAPETATDTPPPVSGGDGPRKFFKLPKISKWKDLSHKQRILSLVICGLLLIGGTAAGLELVIKDPPPPEPVQIAPKKEPPKPKTVASRLTGVQVPPEFNELPTTGVMIENSPDARPQSGLYGAGVVFEAIAEGGITRFLALYQESRPENIGPVRSVRPYYLDFLVPFDAPVAHVGGSGQALAEIRSQGIKDLDQFANPGAFRRVSNRFAPHNMYTTGKQLLDLQRSKGFDKSDFRGFVRKEEKPSKTPNAKGISVDVSSFLYNPSFSYDAKTNSYLRGLAGRPHVDEAAGKQINPKTVVVLVMGYSKNGIYSVYGTTGSGKAFVFQDGILNEGIWEKRSRSDQFRFGDANGAPLGLNPGQTWITLVDNASKVSVTP